MSYTPRSDAQLAATVAGMACPFWVRDLVPVLMSKDPVDVLHALRRLTALWADRVNELERRAS